MPNLVMCERPQPHLIQDDRLSNNIQISSKLVSLRARMTSCVYSRRPIVLGTVEYRKLASFENRSEGLEFGDS